MSLTTTPQTIVLSSHGIEEGGKTCGTAANGTDLTVVTIDLIGHGNAWAQGEIKALGNLKVTFIRRAKGQIYIPTFDPECTVYIGPSSTSNAGLIAGVVIGSIVGAALLVVLVIFLYRRCGKRADYRDV